MYTLLSVNRLKEQTDAVINITESNGNNIIRIEGSKTGVDQAKRVSLKRITRFIWILTLVYTVNKKINIWTWTITCISPVVVCIICVLNIIFKKNIFRRRYYTSFCCESPPDFIIGKIGSIFCVFLVHNVIFNPFYHHLQGLSLIHI